MNIRLVLSFIISSHRVNGRFVVVLVYYRGEYVHAAFDQFKILHLSRVWHPRIEILLQTEYLVLGVNAAGLGVNLAADLAEPLLSLFNRIKLGAGLECTAPHDLNAALHIAFLLTSPHIAEAKSKAVEICQSLHRDSWFLAVVCECNRYLHIIIDRHLRHTTQNFCEPQ